MPTFIKKLTENDYKESELRELLRDNPSKFITVSESHAADVLRPQGTIRRCPMASKPPMTYRDLLLRASRELAQDDLQAAQAVAGASAGMADITVASDALKIGIEEAVAELPPSPTEEWGKPFSLPKGDRLQLPVVEPVQVTHPVAPIGHTAVTNVSIELPIDAAMITTFDDKPLLAAHRFLHMIDILSWQRDKLTWIHQYDVRAMMWLVSVRYRDPLFGELVWSQAVEEHTLVDLHHRRYVLGTAINMLQREREVKAAEVMSTIDKEVIARGLHQDIDYWRPTR